MTQTATSPQKKPLLDEASFQQLLSAAYVLQEHNDRLRGKEVHADFAKNLSAIVETQKLIQTLQLDLEAAAKLVAERVQKITNSAGAAIGIIEKGELVYRAATGNASPDAGTRVTPAASLSADCLSQGSAVNYTDTSANSPARANLFLERHVKSFIAVPVYHAGQVAGVLELRFARTNSFREADLRTAELMAGLLSEAMATAARMKWKDALASERQSMLEALERIKPQLERLGTESLENAVAAKPADLWSQSSGVAKGGVVVPRQTEVCGVCGSDFFDQGEAFCGICGSARPLAPVAAKDVPAPGKLDPPTRAGSPTITPYGSEDIGNGNSRRGNPAEATAATKITAMPASLQELIELSAIQQNPAAHMARHFEKLEVPKPKPVTAAVVPPQPALRTESDFILPAPEAGPPSVKQPHTSSDHLAATDHFAPAVQTVSPATVAANTERDSPRIIPVDSAVGGLAPVNPFATLPEPASAGLQASPWGSAKKAQEWLETVKTHRGPTATWMAHQWQTRRANIYIGIAALILVIVISGWGMRPSATAVAGNASTASGQREVAQVPKLTAFESLLVSLGLAEAPPAPIYMGNPDTQVWVDVHTALYHCPGSELFGKTPDGKLTTQRDAQQDQFEPANRKACP